MNIRNLLCTGLLLVSGSALSAEVDYALRAGLTTSDNVERRPDGLERSSSAAVLGLELRGQRPEGRLRYTVDTDVSYNEYLSHNLDSEVLGRASLRGVYDFVPETFGWNAGVVYDQVRGDILRPLAPGNADDTLTLSTGPTLRARFSEVMGGELEGHLARTSYGDRPFDNETLGARALLTRRASPRSMLAVGGSYDDVSYVSGGAPAGLDFKRKEYFGRVELEGARTGINVEAGYADISGQTVDEGGALLRAHLNRRLTPSMTGYVNAVREYPTSEETTLLGDPSVSVGVDDASSDFTSGPRLATSVGVGLRFTRPRTESSLSYTYREEESLLAGAGQRKYGEWRGDLSRRFTPGVQGTLYARVTEEDFSGIAGNAQDRSVGAQLGISFGKALGLDIRIEHNKRDGITAADDYSELGGGIFLRYSGQL